MGKTLILVRHSRPESRIVSLKDFDRALSKEGISDTGKMAVFFRDSEIRPGLILTSSARRAFETASLFAEILNMKEENIRSSGNLYYSTPLTIMNEIAGIPDETDCLMVVAHNPGISELSSLLSSGRSSYMGNTQVSIFEFDAEKWSYIGKYKPVSFKSYYKEDLD